MIDGYEQLGEFPPLHDLPESLGPTLRKLGKAASRNADAMRQLTHALPDPTELQWHQEPNGVLVGPADHPGILGLILNQVNPHTSSAPIHYDRPYDKGGVLPGYPQGEDKPVDSLRPVREPDTRAGRITAGDA